MKTLADELGSVIERDDHHEGFRVVLGPLEGYDEQGPVHDVAEVQQALPGARVVLAEVFATRHTESVCSVYTEPVAVVEAPSDLIGDVYKLGDILKQERFTIEDFMQGVAYVVETRFCTEPD
jgi:hypothetical protein